MKQLDCLATRRALLGCAVLLLQGCMSTHVEPAEGPRAQVRFVSTIGPDVTNVSVLTYDNENCENRKLVAALTGAAVQHNRKKIGMPLAGDFQDRDITEAYVRAGSPLVYSMSIWTGSIYSEVATCEVTMTFVPAADQMYESYFVANRERCGVDVKRLEKSGDSYVRVDEPTARKGAHRCSIDGMEREPAGS